MEFKEAVNVCLTRKYRRFTGRASRSEFWWFSLFTCILNILVAVLGGLVPALASIVSAVQALWLLLPTIGVTTRRLHDRNLSGWWQALPLALVLPAIAGAALDATWLMACFAGAAGLASLALLVLCALKGTPGSNRFGPDPLDGAEV